MKKSENTRIGEVIEKLKKTEKLLEERKLIGVGMELRQSRSWLENIYKEEKEET